MLGVDDILLAGGIVGATYVAMNAANYLYAQARVMDARAPLNALPGTLSINLPAFQETPEVVGAALESLVNQNILKENPSKYEILFLASAGDRLLDEVLPVVRQY